MELFEHQDCENRVNNAEEIQNALVQSVEKSTDQEKIKKIVGLITAYHVYKTCNAETIVFPEWIRKSIEIFGYTLGAEEEQKEIIEIIRKSIANLMERFGYVFLGMSDWNYLVAQYKLSGKSEYQGAEVILPEEPFNSIGQKVVEENPEDNEFEIEEKVNDIIGCTRDIIEQAITVFLMAVVRRKISTSLYRHLPQIIQDIYQGDSAQALKDLQERREESKFITLYSKSMLRLVGDLGIYHADVSFGDEASDTREEMLSVIRSAASLIFSKSKLEEISLKKILEQADERAVKIITETLLVEMELCIMDGLFENIAT